ncbi:hypothetical protein ACFL0H_14625 [Thermodesulfobacteriota bacterium]
MGREPTRKGQHFLFYAACIVTITLVIPSCARYQKRLLEEYHFDQSDALMRKGEYAASLNEYEAILEEFPRTLGDQALYRIGLIYAHPENRFADEDKAIEAFQGVFKMFPESPLSEKSRLWVLTLIKMKGNRKKIITLNAEISLLKNSLTDKEKIIEFFRNRIEALEPQIEDLKKIDTGKEKSIEFLRNRIEKLRFQIEDLKKIDIGIEEKKRIKTP